jgi:hypothetical protein
VRTKGAISLGPSGNLQGGYKFVALDTDEKITRCNWDAIPMPKLVIARVNILGKDQPKMFTFTDRHGCLIGDAKVPTPEDFGNTEDVDFPGVDAAVNDDIEIPGVDDEEGLEFPTPQEIEIDDDPDINPDPIPVEAETVQEATAQQAPVTEPVQLPELRRSTRAKTQTKPGHVLSMTGSRHGCTVAQLESQGVLHPDAHVFAQQDFYQSEPDVVAMA